MVTAHWTVSLHRGLAELVRFLQDARSKHGRAKPVIDVDDRHSRGASVERGQQRRDAVERTVARARRHGDLQQDKRLCLYPPHTLCTLFLSGRCNRCDPR